MNIDEAIKSLGLKVNNPDIDTRDIQLGIEALEREKLFRERVPRKDWELLPGETEGEK